MITFVELEPELEFTVLDGEDQIGIIAISGDGSMYAYYPQDEETETPDEVTSKLEELNV